MISRSKQYTEDTISNVIIYNNDSFIYSYIVDLLHNNRDGQKILRNVLIDHQVQILDNNKKFNSILLALIEFKLVNRIDKDLYIILIKILSNVITRKNMLNHINLILELFKNSFDIVDFEFFISKIINDYIKKEYIKIFIAFIKKQISDFSYKDGRKITVLKKVRDILLERISGCKAEYDSDKDSSIKNHLSFLRKLRFEIKIQIFKRAHLDNSIFPVLFIIMFIVSIKYKYFISFYSMIFNDEIINLNSMISIVIVYTLLYSLVASIASYLNFQKIKFSYVNFAFVGVFLFFISSNDNLDNPYMDLLYAIFPSVLAAFIYDYLRRLN